MQPLYWLLAAAVLLVLEMLSMGLTTIWFAGGALIAALSAVLHFPMMAQILLFLVVSFVLLLLTRPLAKKHLNNKTVKTNVEGLVGQKCIVTESIDNLRNKGQVSLKGQIWSAKSVKDDILIPQSAVVKVEAITGVKVVVSVISIPEKIVPKMEDL